MPPRMERKTEFPARAEWRACGETLQWCQSGETAQEKQGRDPCCRKAVSGGGGERALHGKVVVLELHGSGRLAPAVVPAGPDSAHIASLMIISVVLMVSIVSPRTSLSVAMSTSGRLGELDPIRR